MKKKNEGEQEWGRGNAVEAKIYSGIGFTRFHPGPLFLFFPLPPFKNTWCKLTLTSRESKGRKERGNKGIGQSGSITTRRGNFRDCCEV